MLDTSEEPSTDNKISNDLRPPWSGKTPENRSKVNLVWSFSEVDQCVAITLYWPGNKSAQINASNLVARENSANIAGTKGEIEVRQLFRFNVDDVKDI